MTLPFAQQSFPELYERFLVGPLFAPWADALLDAAGLAQGDRVLDVACGTGIVARRAKERLGADGTVVGVDVNGGMLAVARREAPAVDWREGSAAALPLEPDERFDLVTCQQGFQFMADGEAVIGEFRRALGPGGRLAVSTWRSDEEFPVLRALRAIAERHVGPIDDRRHALGDPAPVEAQLREAGFRRVASQSDVRTIRFPDGAVFVRLNAMALVGMSAGGRERSDADRERLVDAIVRESASLVEEHTGARGFAYEIGTNVTTAEA